MAANIDDIFVSLETTTDIISTLLEIRTVLSSVSNSTLERCISPSSLRLIFSLLNTENRVYEIRCVNSLEDVHQEIRSHELEKSTKYVTIKKDKMFGKEDSDLQNSEVRFEDTQKTTVPYIPFDGVPFIIIGRKRMACHHGTDTHQKEKERRKDLSNQQGDHDYKRKRKLLQPTKKKDCTAGIRIRHIVKFPDYKLSDNGKRSEKDSISYDIKYRLGTGQSIKKEHTFLISIPDDSEHKNHFMGEDASIIQPIDKELKEYISLMVSQHHVVNTFQMRLLLEVFVKQSLFQGQTIPSRLNKRFWPSNKDIKNHIALALHRLRNTNVDQAVVLELVNKWKKEYPNDNFFIKLKEDIEEELNDDFPVCTDTTDEEIDTGDVLLNDETLKLVPVPDQKFFFIHQSSFQKQLLEKYGQEICLMDATYRTTQYAVPLYFICVPTNVNYMTVATFITETEDSNSLIFVLQKLREWNPEWKPSFFMCDYATEEINAIETVFPESFVYLCDFHREQSWDRWLSASHNGVHNYKPLIIELLRNVAESCSDSEFEEAVNKLKGSAFWTDHKNLRDWFEKYWLSKYDRWVRAYRQNRFNRWVRAYRQNRFNRWVRAYRQNRFNRWVRAYRQNRFNRWVRAYRQNRFNVSINTNNGIERQNLALKYEYLQSRKASSLSHLLTTIIDSFNYCTYRKYRKLNTEASDLARKYSSDIPDFLTNRPPQVVKHCFKRWQEAENIPSCDIQEIYDHHGTFIVKSQESKDTVLHYLVKFERNEIGLPSCDCKDWKSSHLPCKHFFAVFQNYNTWGWENLPLAFRNNPFLNLDISHEITGSRDPFIEDEDEDDEANNDVISDGQYSSITDLPVPSAATLKRTRQKLLSLCEIIKDLSHKTKDVDLLNTAVENTTSVVNLFQSSLPQTSEFILDDADMTYIGTSKKIPKKKTYHNLKKTKPKKKGTGRVGKKATKEKEGHSSKGVNELLTKNKEYPVAEVTEEGVEEGVEMFTIIEEGKQLKMFQNVKVAKREDEENNTRLVVENNTRLEEENNTRLEEENNTRLEEENNTRLSEGSEGVVNHSPISKLLNDVKAFMSNTSMERWYKMVDLAENTYNRTLDMTAQIGYTVLFASCSDSTDDVAEVMMQMSCLMPIHLQHDTKIRLALLVLEQMVNEKMITLKKSDDPRIKQGEMSKAMEELMNNPMCSSLRTRNGNLQRVKGNSRGIAPILKVSESEQRDGRKRRINFDVNVKPAKESKISCIYPFGGLLNPRGTNLCFANALLQCFRETDLHRILQLHETCSDHDRCFTCAFRDFIEEGPCTAEPLVQKLKDIWHDYRFGQQQDAHEFFEKLMQEVYDKCLKTNQDCIASSIFYGLQRSTVTCDSCGAKSTKEEIYSDISVSIDEVQTVLQAVKNHFSPVTVEYKCSICKNKNHKATKVTTLESIPKNIVIHLKRFSGSLRKISKKIDIAFDLHLRSYVSQGKELEDKAQLFAVVVHSGRSATSGHYYSFVKFAQHWFRIDDIRRTSVTELCLENCKDQNYMLFYRTLPRPYIS